MLTLFPSVVELVDVIPAVASAVAFVSITGSGTKPPASVTVVPAEIVELKLVPEVPVVVVSLVKLNEEPFSIVA